MDAYSRLSDSVVVASISNPASLESDELIVPVRAVNGATVATFVLGAADRPEAPTPARVPTIEPFMQQAASIIENARFYEESQRGRGRGEALRDIARAVSGSFRLAVVASLNDSAMRDLRLLGILGDESLAEVRLLAMSTPRVSW